MNLIRIAGITSPNIVPPTTPQYQGEGTGLIRISEAKITTVRAWNEEITVSDTSLNRTLSSQLETISVTDEPIRLILRSLTENMNLIEDLTQFRTVTENLALLEGINSTFQRVLQENINYEERVQRLSPLRLEESMTFVEQIPRHSLLEIVSFEDNRNTLYRMLEDTLLFSEKFYNFLPLPFPSIPVGDQYTSPIALFSVGMKQLWQLIVFAKSVNLVGNITPQKKRTKIINIVESVGMRHEPSPKWQKYAQSTESWTNIFSASPDWLDGFIVRDAFVDRRRLLLVLARATLDVSKIRATSIDSVKIVVINLASNPPTVREFNETKLFPNARDKFGFFTMGHGLFTGLIGNQAFGIIFNETTGDADLLRFAYISEEFRKTNPPYPSILVVPEGFLFLPNNILYDLETFHNLPSLNANAFYLPIYPSRPVIVRRETTNKGNTINEAFIWLGLGPKFVRMDVLPAPNIQPAAPSLKGDIIGNQWVAWGLSGDDIDEHLLYTYKTQYSADTKRWELIIDKLPYSYYPLPNTGVWSYLPNDPRWAEITLNLVGNGDVLYFNRLWNRVYRVQLSTEGAVKVNKIPHWDALLNRSDEKVIENPVISHIAYDKYNGEVYSIIASLPPAHPYITVSKQNAPYNPPPPPTIIFPYNNWSTSRRPVVIIRPAVHSKPQEFLIRMVPKEFVDRYGTSVEEAPGYEFFSAANRNGWEVSYDGGTTWQPMQNPILRQNNNVDVLVRFNTPASLPEGGYYYIIASAYSRPT